MANKIKEGVLTVYLKSIISAAVLIALIAPLIIKRNVFFPFVSSKAFFFMAFAQIAFFAWLVLAFHNRKYLPSKNIVFIAVSLFIFIFILSSFLGVDPSRSFWSNNERMTGLLVHLHLFGLFLASASVFNRIEWKRFLFFSCIIASIVSILGLYDRIFGVKFIDFVGGSTLGNTSFLGTYLLFNAFIALYLLILALQNNNRPSKIWAGSMFALIAVGIILNPGGRAAFIAFVIGMFLTALFWVFLTKKGVLKITSAFALFVFFVVFILGFLIMIQPGSEFTEKILERFNMGTIGGRIIVWDIAAQGVLERPFLGWGPENFELAFTKHYNPCLGTDMCGADVWYDRAHNFFFDNLIFIGIFGLIAYMFMFFAPVFLFWKKRYFLETAIFSGVFAAYLVQGTTVFDMMGSLIMIFLLLGFAAGFFNQENKALKQGNFPKNKNANHNTGYGANYDTSYIFIFFIFLFFIFSFNNFVIKPHNSSIFTIEAFRASPGSEEKLGFYKKAVFTSSMGRHQIRHHFSSRLVDFIKQEDSALREGTSNEIGFLIEELEKGIKESPLDYKNYLRLAELYDAYYIVHALKDARAGGPVSEAAVENLNKAEQFFIKAMEISPAKQDSYWGLSEVYIRQRKTDKAVALIEKAVELEPLLLRSHVYLVRIIEQIIKDESLAEEKKQRAVEINPNWSKVFYEE